MIVRLTCSPASERMSARGVSNRSNGTPFSAEILSLATIPAAAAGEPGCTASSVSSPRSASGPARRSINAKARRRLTRTPASMTIDFERSDARSHPSSSLLPSVAPAMRTKPPNGRAFSVRRVRDPRCSTAIRGGKPMPNSSTAIPRQRATSRWPSSCTTINGTTRRIKTRSGPTTPPMSPSSSAMSSAYAGARTHAGRHFSAKF